MRIPKMVIFDFGQTLIKEEPFDGVSGTRAVLEQAANNPNNVSAEDIQAFAEGINNEVGRFGTDFKNIRTAVISNIGLSGKFLKAKIDSYFPSNEFEFIIASSEYIFRKPHKRIFELALRKAKLDASKVWYCGDNAVFDVDGAANCGIFPVWYKGAIEKSNKAIPKSDCLQINDWKELIRLLE